MENIDEIVELDRLNMTPVIERTGSTFDPDLRRKKIIAELQEGAVFFSVRRAGETVAYLEYMPELHDTWNIMSLQVHPAHQSGTVLRDLLTEGRRCLQANVPSCIRSSVHVTNQTSLRLHHKLEFVKTEEKDGRILFVTEGKILLKRLACFKKGKENG